MKNCFVLNPRVETLNQKEYMLVRSGIEPHIEERTPSLPSGASLTNKLIESGDKSTYSSTNDKTITDNTLSKAESESTELEKLDPPHNISRVSEAEVAKSLSSDAAPHDDLSIYCDFDNETIPQNSSECQEQDDSNDEPNESTHKRRKP